MLDINEIKYLLKSLKVMKSTDHWLHDEIKVCQVSAYPLDGWEDSCRKPIEAGNIDLDAEVQTYVPYWN